MNGPQPTDAIEPDSDTRDRGLWDAARGDVLRNLRIERGLRQQELAAAVDQPRTVLSNWENGIRVPSAAMRSALAAALQVEPSALDVPIDAIVDSGPDRWSVLHAQLAGLIADDDQVRVDRFMRQSDVFAELADNELAAVRWSRLYSAAHAYRTELGAVKLASASGFSAARAIGQQLAVQVRNQLGVSTSPLPALEVTAERSGLHVFIAYLKPGPHGRIRVIAAEHEAVGVTALLNAALDGRHRLFALAELLGRLLFHPHPASAVLATRSDAERARRRSIRGTAADAFAAEFVLPTSSARREADFVDSVTARDALSDSLGGVARARASVLADLLQTYRVPVAVAMSHLQEAWRLSVDERRQLLTRLGSILWREPSSIGELGRSTAADLPPRFLSLLVAEVEAARSSLQGVAELAGVDISELRPIIEHSVAGSLAADDGWLDESGSAVA